MSWSTYGSYLVFVAIIALAPGPDTMVVLKNALAGGARGGLVACSGITVANALQAAAVGLGLGAVIVRSQPVFEVLRWAGVVYLCYLGVQALRGAWRGDYRDLGSGDGRRAGSFRRWREGFLSNITNPKVLAFYLSVLPQFLEPGRAATGDALLLAFTVVVIGAAWQLLLLLLVHRVRGWLSQRRVRRVLDTVTGTALLGFGIGLAVES